MKDKYGSAREMIEVGDWYAFTDFLDNNPGRGITTLADRFHEQVAPESNVTIDVVTFMERNDK